MYKIERLKVSEKEQTNERTITRGEITKISQNKRQKYFLRKDKIW